MVAFFHGLLLYFFTYVVCNVTVIIMCVMVVLGLSKTGQEVVGMKRFEHQTQPALLHRCFLSRAYNSKLLIQ